MIDQSNLVKLVDIVIRGKFLNRVHIILFPGGWGMGEELRFGGIQPTDSAPQDVEVEGCQLSFSEER